jgi:hypothetical protein
MKELMLVAVVAVAMLALLGCHANATYLLSGGAGQVYLSTNTMLVVGSMMADDYRYYAVDPSGSKTPLGRAPEMDPTRRINVQDCTQPVDLQAGNLMCK